MLHLLIILIIIFLADSSKGAEEWNIGDCGIRYDQFQPMISYGLSTGHNQYPWHVALFRMDTSTYQYICGGSIIDANIVITAAHCVFDEEKQDVDYKSMVIATGKYHGSWRQRDAHEQRLEVISKKVPSTYRGSENRFQDDIALLALNDSIKFSSIVMPICIDWASSYEPYDGELAILVGWGLNERNVLSEELQITRMEQSNFGECRNKVEKGFTSFLTSDKFCAFTIDLSELEQGDSGGGLVFSRTLIIKNETKERNFLYGVLSGKQNSNGYYFFTNISSHMHWINSTKMNINDDTNLRKVCGIRNAVNDSEPGGYTNLYTGYPWLATIYMTKKNKFFGIRCVGTIIHQRAIITSVWCVRDRRSHYKGVEFKILIGKSEMNMREEEEGQQHLNIYKRLDQENYLDWNHRSENELIILIVDEEIKFSKSVAPICIDWDRKLPLEDQTGMVASWDIDNCHCQTQATYKYLDNEECSEAFGDSEEYETYVTWERGCGKYVNGTRFIHGSDVGSGYFFLKNGTRRHYLQGIVRKGRPTFQDFLTFTNVELNLRWISDYLVTIYNPGFWGK